MAAMSGKIIQNVSVANCYQRNRQFCTQHQRAFPPLNMCNLLPFQGGKLAWTDISAMHLRFLSRTGCLNRVTVYCNAAPSTTAISSLEKVDFRKLQNGSDIRGVAVAGVEGEPVNLTEPVTEAIAAAFAAWLLDKKKPDVSRHLRVLLVMILEYLHRSYRQDAVSGGIAGAGLDVVQYGFAVTRAHHLVGANTVFRKATKVTRLEV